MAVAKHPITAAERARRTRVHEEPLASVRLEGFELDEQMKALYQRYIDGQMTLAEVGSLIDGLDDREFGPVSLNRHKRPQEPARSH
jgi:Antitoxin VbhA